MATKRITCKEWCKENNIPKRKVKHTNDNK